MVLGNRSTVLKRRLKIAELVRRSGEARVDELSQILSVSAVTIRSDLTYLEGQGLIIRSAGKAIAMAAVTERQGDDPETLPRAKVSAMLRAARALIDPEQALLIGPGPLALQVIPLLADTAGLSLILSSLDAVPLALRCLDCEVSMLAGRLGADGSSLEGPRTLQSLRVELVDTFIFEVNGINRKGEFIFLNSAAEQLCAQGCQQARRSIALVRETYLLQDSPVYSLPIAEADYLVLPAATHLTCREDLILAGFEPFPGEAETPVFHRRS
jgi:DeoR/GlpR family transcriptional regulator of sugar metabolism